MSASTVSFFPLEEVTESDLRNLCKALWSWEYCSKCNNGEICSTANCLWQTSRRFEPFFQFYRELTAWVVPEVVANGHYALRNHNDLFSIIKLLREKPNVKRSLLTKEHFATYGKNCEPDVTDQHRAFNLAVRVMAMVDCTFQVRGLGALELGAERIIWGNDETLDEFLISTFPMKHHPSLDQANGSSDVLRQVNAKRLKTVARLKIVETDDLRNHLNLDLKTGIVQIYHYTTFLKGHLMATRGCDQVSTFPGASIRGIIPRNLALETLDSLQLIFPLDLESRNILRSLTVKHNFDPDCLQLGSGYRQENEQEIGFNYWGTRLMDLYYEVENPKPRGILQEFLEMNSGARHIMMATIAGVIIAVILGVLTLAVGIYQAWLTYQQWRHPFSTEKS